MFGGRSSKAHRTGSACGDHRCAVPAGRIRSDSGQSLIIVVLAMTLIVALTAFSIDVGQWYVGHHRTQVAADATALAAANCLASIQCQTTPDAETAGNKVASANGFSSVSYAWTPATGSTNATVKVTVQNTTPAAFGGLFGIHSANTSASATAAYYTLTSSSPACAITGASNCYSLFAGNDVCPNPDPTISSKSFDYVGLDLITQDNGSGKATMSEMYSNAYYYNGGNSAASAFSITTVGTGTTPSCSPTVSNSSTSNYLTVPKVLPYPEVWTAPTCTPTRTASSWTTASINSAGYGPGVYCVTAATGTTVTCSDDASGTNDIAVDMSKLTTAGGYEFVGPCVSIMGWSTTATNITGQPLVYGTSNIQLSNGTPEYATATALPTCVKNDGTNLTSTYLDGSPTQGPTIYDQCGTAEITQNSGYTGFVEAWNISVDKNNGVTGNGPTSVSGGGGPALPGGDQLTQ